MKKKKTLILKQKDKIKKCVQQNPTIMSGCGREWHLHTLGGEWFVSSLVGLSILRKGAYNLIGYTDKKVSWVNGKFCREITSWEE